MLNIIPMEPHYETVKIPWFLKNAVAESFLNILNSYRMKVWQQRLNYFLITT